MEQQRSLPGVADIPSQSPCLAKPSKRSRLRLAFHWPNRHLGDCHNYQDPLFRLAATSFRKSYEFHSSTGAGSDEARSYKDFLVVILDNALFMLLVPLEVLSLPFRLRV